MLFGYSCLYVFTIGEELKQLAKLLLLTYTALNLLQTFILQVEFGQLKRVLSFSAK